MNLSTPRCVERGMYQESSLNPQSVGVFCAAPPPTLLYPDTCISPHVWDPSPLGSQLDADRGSTAAAVAAAT
eukprot:360137-Chlamydomonas_euryale.AAC.8